MQYREGQPRQIAIACSGTSTCSKRESVRTSQVPVSQRATKDGIPSHPAGMHGAGGCLTGQSGHC